jgi:hypothetical protein
LGHQAFKSGTNLFKHVYIFPTREKYRCIEMQSQFNTARSHVNSQSAKLFSLESRLAYKKAKDPQYAWAAKKSIQHKHSAGLKLFFQTIVACSNVKGISEVGIDAQIKKHLSLHGVVISKPTAERYVARLKEQRLITKYEREGSYSSSPTNRGKSPGQIRWKTHCTRLAWVSTIKVMDIIYPTKDIYMGEGADRVGKVDPSTPEAKAPTPLDAASGFAEEVDTRTPEEREAQRQKPLQTFAELRKMMGFVQVNGKWKQVCNGI